MRLDPARTVFIDVDTQVDFMEPHGALYVPGAETLKPRLARLLEAARAAGAPIVASADAHLAGDPEFAQFPPHCLAGTPGQERVAETAHEGARVIAADGTEREPGAGAVLLEKVAFDLFTNPAADAVLEEVGAEVAVVFGVALDYCVRAAALGLRARGLETVVVEDATRPVTEATGATARAELEAAGVRFVDTEAVVGALADASPASGEGDG